MDAAVATGVVAGSVFFILLLGFVLWALLVVAHWRMFTKAGEAGWKSIIPIYSDYTMFKLVWNTNAFWVSLICSAVMLLSMSLSGSYAVSESGHVIATGGGNFFFDILTFISSIGALFFSVMLSLKTALAYGKGTLYAIGLVLLPNIFMIIAFGDARYRGPQD